MTRLSEVAKLAPAPTTPQPKLQQQVVAGKKRAKRFAELGAGIGLGTLALRAPQAASWAARRSPKLATKAPVKRLIRAAPKATKVSEALVPVSLGTGALGSLNFASLQGKEAKSHPVTTAKADDAFMRKHRNYISEGAERGYKDLGERAGRRKEDRAAYAGLASAGAAAATKRALPGLGPHVQARVMNATMLRHGAKRAVPAIGKPRGWGLILAAPAAVATGNLVGRGYARHKEVKSLEGRQEKIRNKAYERKAAGQFGRPAALRKDDRGLARTHDLSKAMWGMPRVGMVPRPGVRPGGLMRLRTGKVVTRRGSIPGTGRLF